MRMGRRSGWLAVWLAVVLMLQACAGAPAGQGRLPAAFDPENPQEYGVRGIHLGQNIKEAMDVLKPTQADFMDAVTRESFTVDQLASGAGTVVTGMLLVDGTQMMIKVRGGVLESIILGGVSKEAAPQFKTNRGLAVYDSVERLKQLYGAAPGDKDVVYQGSKYRASFSLHDNQVIGIRFDAIR
jgi:hypothetical protein